MLAMRVLIYAITLLFYQCALFGATDFGSKAFARANFIPKGPQPTVWMGTSSVTGASRFFASVTETRWHDTFSGDYLYSDFSSFISITMSGGTVVALPAEDFQVADEFTYLDSDGRTVLAGKHVTVKVGISTRGKDPAPVVKLRTVKNLCESGMAVPGTKGKPGRLIALKTGVKRRFGATNVEVSYHDHQASTVHFLLWKCNPDAECPKVSSFFYEGQKFK